MEYSPSVASTVEVLMGMGPPNYDSGFLSIAKGGSLRLDHFLGGDPHKFFVDLTCQGSMSLCQSFFSVVGVPGVNTWGAFWHDLTDDEIYVTRGPDDETAVQVRVRIWRY